MILKFVIKNFRRRKVRTILMVLSLMVSTGLIVAMSATVETIRQSNVELIAAATGRYDLAIRKTEVSPDPFIDITSTTQKMMDADPRITAVHPRFLSLIELTAKGNQGNGFLIALDPESEELGFVEVISGTYQLGNGNTAILEDTAATYDLQLGDTVEVAYSFPQPREEGRAGAVGSSQRRAVGSFTVGAIVRQNGVINENVREGLMIHLNDAQSWLGLPDRAEQIVALVDPSLYEARNAEAVALAVRDVASAAQVALGKDYIYSLDKAAALYELSVAFLVIQALINAYGLMALGVVGLLVHTLVMTNVREQKREMAIIRILGSQRNYLFALVMAEVAVIGAIGLGLGILLGQLITIFGVVPFIEWQISEAGLSTAIEPAVSLAAVLPAIVSATLVLFLSALKPAQDAAKTKVIHAINPSVADNIQLEDLEELRERRPNTRLFIIGLGMMFVVLMTIGLDVVSTLGNPAAEATFILLALIFMVVGVGFVFLIFARPLERLLLLLIGLLASRLTYFARRNVGRSHVRNTLISLLVLFSGVLPTFLATQSAISNANIETDVRLSTGAPVDIRVFGGSAEDDQALLNRLRPSFIDQELKEVSGIEQAIGLTYGYTADVSDAVDLRAGSVSLTGVTGDLNEVLYGDMLIMTAGGPAALTTILDDPQSVVISQGLSEALAIPMGGIMKIQGEGLDHVVEARVVGIAQRVPGFNNISRIRSVSQYGSTVFISLEGFRRLVTDPSNALPPEDDPILTRIMANTTLGVNGRSVADELRSRFGLKYDVWMRLTEVALQQAREERVQVQALLLVLTLISFTTAVFGVFAVNYVTIYARRLEIGMMKAVGSRSWELTGMFIVEAIAMTLSAALAGILAGATMAYLFAFFDNLTSQRPMRFAVDTTVVPFIVFLVVLASVLGAAFSARRIVKQRAVEILRMS